MTTRARKVGTTPSLSSVKPPDPWGSCDPMDLTPLLGGGFPPPEMPGVLARTDGNCLLYAKSTNMLLGEPESGKTLLAQVAGARAMLAGRHVRVIDFENTRDRWIERYACLGVPVGIVVEFLHYSRIDVRLLDAGDLTAGGQRLVEQASTYGYDNITIDSVGGLYGMEGFDSWSDQDAEHVQAVLFQPLAEASGGAVLLLDHVVKHKPSQGRWATGSQRKIGSLSGAAYRVEMITPWPKPSDAVVGSVEGAAKLRLVYDTPGGVRAFASLETIDQFPIVAEMRVTVTSTQVNVLLAGVGGVVMEAFDLDVLAFIDANPEVSQSKVEHGIGKRADEVRRSIRKLSDKGHINNRGTGRRMRLVSTALGRDLLAERRRISSDVGAEDDE